ncbi:alpha-ketoglutarate-dependent dioxygenase AlkB [Microbulbifer flavimaris]|uniref:Alpha-ketoglutarate-dependent dioxygenase AlkB n=1 Tax=Microbulbifer flavimaris TaxID=1781068 RepID=A0ABX4I416_9GAMM|nr:alpha-ketoglutarate-dependent dioxygenase AlkB [Microbulbifer flavimaris]
MVPAGHQRHCVEPDHGASEERLDERRFLDLSRQLTRRFPRSVQVPLTPGCGLLVTDWLSDTEAEALMAHCLAALHWDQPQVRLFGREYPIPRRHAFVGDPDVTYRWSGLEQHPQVWTPELAEVRDRLAESGFTFNSLLANHYRNGADGMGWHADNERELGASPVVATISLGQPRRLSFRERHGAGRQALDLPSGSLLLTSGAVQHHWQHQVAKSRRLLDPRISLTFRYIHSIG